MGPKDMKRIMISLLLCLVLYPFEIVYADDDYDDSFSVEDISSLPSSDDSYLDSNKSTNADDYNFGNEFREPTNESNNEKEETSYSHTHKEYVSGSSNMPAFITAPGEKVIVVNPRIHAWGAYSETGKLMRSGLATAGSSWCDDLQRPCRTKTGVFRIYSLGDETCVSKKFPLGEGGAPMPYCMYFNGGQGIHGSHELAHANLSHGCVRISVSDAKWLRYNFTHVNTKVIVKPY